MASSKSCLDLASRLETSVARQLGADHPQTLHLQFHIANVLRSQGRFTEARDLDTYVLERQRVSARGQPSGLPDHREWAER